MVLGVKDVLEHHGIKGQKWGVRKASRATESSSAPSSHDAAKAKEYQTKAKAGGTKTLSNQELQHLVNRMNLEQNYSRLNKTSSKSKKGAKFATDFLANVGKQQAAVIVGGLIAKQVASVLKG